jgi:hypothetical protein
MIQILQMVQNELPQRVRYGGSEENMENILRSEALSTL